MNDPFKAHEHHRNAYLVRKFTVGQEDGGLFAVRERKASGYGYTFQYLCSYKTREEAEAAVKRHGSLLSPYWYDGVD